MLCFCSQFCLYIWCIDDMFFADSFGGATACVVDGTEISSTHLVCRNCNILTISLYYLIFSHIRILLCTARKIGVFAPSTITSLDFSVSIYSHILRVGGGGGVSIIFSLRLFEGRNAEVCRRIPRSV